VGFVHARPYSLRCPEKIAQFVQGQGLPRIDAPALAVPDGFRKVNPRNILPLAKFGQLDPDSVGREWLFDRRGGYTPILIGFRKIDSLADAVLQEIAKLLQNLLIYFHDSEPPAVPFDEYGAERPVSSFPRTGSTAVNRPGRGDALQRFLPCCF
jgi:hypothetical protein